MPHELPPRPTELPDVTAPPAGAAPVPAPEGYHLSGWYDETFVAIMGIREGLLRRRETRNRDLIVTPEEQRIRGAYLDIAQIGLEDPDMRNGRPVNPAHAPQPGDIPLGRLAPPDSSFDARSAYLKANFKPRPGPFGVPPKDRRETRLTSRHEGAAVRGQLRRDQEHVRANRIGELAALHGNIIIDKEALDEHLRTTDLRLGEKRSIQRASREARRNMRALLRIRYRRVRAARGQDLAGRFAS